METQKNGNGRVSWFNGQVIMNMISLLFVVIGATWYLATTMAKQNETLATTLSVKMQDLSDKQDSLQRQINDLPNVYVRQDVDREFRKSLEAQMAAMSASIQAINQKLGMPKASYYWR